MKQFWKWITSFGRRADKTEKKVGDLTNDARASLADLLRLEKLGVDQWYLCISVASRAGEWELLTSNPAGDANDRIKERLALSKQPISDLVLAFVGNVDHRGKKQLMAHVQYFRQGYPTGLLFGCHLAAKSASGKLEVEGGFLIFGGCQNLWI